MMKQCTFLLLLLMPIMGFAQVNFPITFEDTASIDYMLADFGGNASMIVTDPTDSTNLVGQATKNGPEVWAGTVVGGSGLTSPIAFTAEETKITVRVWSPTAGTPILLKVENNADAAIFAETSVNTTMAGEWETLEFDLSTPSNGVFDLANIYDKIAIFFNFGTVGEGEIYYWDDMIFEGGGGTSLMQVDLPITFEDTSTVDYGLADFGGNASMIVVDPTDENNLVGQATKNGPEVWAGTTMGGSGLASPIPFSSDMSKVTVRVWSPTAETPILLKVEDAADAGIFVEVSVNTTMAEAWEMLEFDFSSPTNGTLNLDNTYDKISIFFNFGTVGEGQVYYWDDVMMGEGGGSNELMQVDLPITFEDTATVDYNLADFGGNASMIVVDPTDENNLVGQATKDGPETWAGTVVGGSGLANAIPFDAENTKMSMRVWSPTAGTPILFKIENAADAGIFAETQVNTTVAEDWETLEFDLGSPSNGAFDLSNTYDKIAIFFDFGTVGTGEIYYFDDITFLGSSNVENIDFERAGIKVSPNPAQDFINLELPTSFNIAAPLYLFDMNGKMVLKQTISNATPSINTSDLSEGIYYLNIRTENANYVQKVMIAK